MPILSKRIAVEDIPRQQSPLLSVKASGISRRFIKNDDYCNYPRDLASEAIAADPSASPSRTVRLVPRPCPTVCRTARSWLLTWRASRQGDTAHDPKKRSSHAASSMRRHTARQTTAPCWKLKVRSCFRHFESSSNKEDIAVTRKGSHCLRRGARRVCEPDCKSIHFIGLETAVARMHCRA